MGAGRQSIAQNCVRIACELRAARLLVQHVLLGAARALDAVLLLLVARLAEADAVAHEDVLALLERFDLRLLAQEPGMGMGRRV